MPKQSKEDKFSKINLGTTIKVCIFLGAWGGKFGATPFEWDKLTQKICKTKSRRKLYSWYLVIFYFVCNISFMAFRLVQAACCMNVTYGRLFMNLLSLTTFTGTTWLHFNTVFRAEQVADFINQMVTTNQYFEQKYSTSDEKENKDRSDWKSPAKRIVIGCFSYCTSQFLIALKGAKNPKYFMSLVYTKDMAKWKLIPFAFFEAFFSFSCGFHLLFYIILNLAYARNTKQCLRLLMERINSSEVKKVYRTLQLLNSRFNGCMKSIVQPATTVIVLFVNILSNYATFKLYHEVKLPGFLGFPLVWLATSTIAKETLPMSAEVQSKSNALIEAMRKDRTSTLYSQKVAKSFRPLIVYVRDLYIIGEKTTLTFFQIAIDNTVFLLLSF